MADAKSQVAKLLAEEVVRAIKKMTDDNNKNYVAPQIQSGSGGGGSYHGTIDAGQVTGLYPKLASYLTATPDMAESGNEDAAKIITVLNSISDVWIKNATIDTAVIQKLYATYGEFINLVAEKIKAGDAEFDTLKSSFADIQNANIGSAKIGYGQIKDADLETAIITTGAAGQLYINKLAVTDANIVSISAGEIMLKDKDGNLVRLVVDDDGNVISEVVSFEGDSIIDDGSLDGSKIIENSITARELNVSQIFADQALIRAIKASNIDVATLFANETFTNTITSPEFGEDLDIGTNASIQLAKTFIKLLVENTIDDITEETELSITDGLIKAIGNKFSVIADEIDLSANDSISLKINNQVSRGSTAPETPSQDQLWLDTSGTTAVWKKYVNNEWVVIEDADDLPTGSNELANTLVAVQFNLSDRIDAQVERIDSVEDANGELSERVQTAEAAIEPATITATVLNQTKVTGSTAKTEFEQQIASIAVTPTSFNTVVGQQLADGTTSLSALKQTADKVELIVDGDGKDSQGKLTLTQDALEAISDRVNVIANDINFTSNNSIVSTVTNSTTYKNDLAAVEMTTDKFETYVQNSNGIGSISAKANEVDLVVSGTDSQGRVVITDNAVSSIASKIDLRANESVTAVVGDQIRKSGLINDNIYIGSKNLSGSKWAEVWPDMLTTLVDDGTYNGFAVKKITYVNTPLSQYHPLESKTTYTYSAYVKRTPDAQVKFFAGETDKFNIDITDQIGTEWSRFAITFTANEVNDNLFTGTQNFDGDRWQWIVGGWGDIIGRTDIDSSFRVKGASGYACTPTQEIMAYAGEVYTLSMYIARSADAQLMFICENTPDVGKDLSPYVTGAMQRINITFTVNQDGIIRPRIDNGNHDGGAMHIAAIKLERGDHATRWTAAPEDPNKNIDYNHMSTRVLKTSETGAIWLCGIKLEKGDIATDWSPSPDDATYTGNEPPLNPYTGKLWLDTSTTPNQLKTYDGQNWNLVGDFDMIWDSYADMQRIQDNLKTEQDKYAKVFDFKQDGLHIHPMVDAGETYESETIMTDKAFDIKVSGTLAAEFAADNVRLGGNSFVRMVPGYFILGG